MKKEIRLKFDILEYTQSSEFSIDGLAEKLNQLTNISKLKTCKSCKFF